jgi:hypothetical protein
MPTGWREKCGGDAKGTGGCRDKGEGEPRGLREAELGE